MFNCVHFKFPLVITVITRIAVTNGNTLQQNCDNRYVCRDGTQCVDKTKLCDGTVDCVDGSDETHALCFDFIDRCQRNTFRCAYGGCVDGAAKCNGVKDCADNSDELLLTCPGLQWLTGSFPKCGSSKFQCRNGDCIKTFKLCDGKADCSDGSDESITQCNNGGQSCPRNSFRCAYGACVDGDAKCNFVEDCADGSDEDYVLCNRTQPTVAQPPLARPTLPSPQSGNTNGSHSTPDSGLQCTLPSFSGTSYRCFENSTSEKCQLKPGSKINSNTYVYFQCDNQFGTLEPVNTLGCVDGRWHTQNAPCIRLCPPLAGPLKETLNLQCKYRGRTVNCSALNYPETIAEPSCKEGYTLDKQLTTIRCLHGGEWERKIQFCNHNCGILNSQSRIQTNSESVHNADIANHPWHVGIYLKTNKAVELLCSGTLISNNAVLTARNCMINEAKNYSQRQKKRLKIGLGKYHLDWNSNEDASFQERSVTDIHSPVDVTEKQDHQDVVILELSAPVLLSNFSMPVCIDKNKLYKLERNMMGTVVGWGLHSRNIPAEMTVLKSAKVPFIPRDECATTYVHSFIASEKFCAFSPNGTDAPGVGPRDNGAGLTYEMNGVHYVYGVVSRFITDEYINLNNTKNLVNIFTNVVDNDILSFIVNCLKKINDKHM